MRLGSTHLSRVEIADDAPHTYALSSGFGEQLRRILVMGAAQTAVFESVLTDFLADVPAPVGRIFESERGDYLPQILGGGESIGEHVGVVSDAASVGHGAFLESFVDVRIVI